MENDFYEIIFSKFPFENKILLKENTNSKKIEEIPRINQRTSN